MSSVRDPSDRFASPTGTSYQPLLFARSSVRHIICDVTLLEGRMAVELGIALDLSGPAADPQALVELAQRAEEGGLDLVVLDGTADEAGLDPWTSAAWVAGKTARIQIGVVCAPMSSTDAPSGPRDARVPYPAVMDKAHHSLDLLAGTRFLTSASAWVTGPASAQPDDIRALAADSRP